MAIGSKEIKRHFGNIGQISGSIKNTKIGKKHNLHRTRGVSPKELDKRLKCVLTEVGVGNKDIEKIYASKSTPIKNSGKIAEDIFKKIGKDAVKGYQKKKILESIDSFAQIDSEPEFKSKRQNKNDGWSGLFRKKNKQERKGNNFVNTKQEQINSIINNKEVDIGNKDDNSNEVIPSQKQSANIFQIKTRLKDNEDNDSVVHFPLPKIKIEK